MIDPLQIRSEVEEVNGKSPRPSPPVKQGPCGKTTSVDSAPGSRHKETIPLGTVTTTDMAGWTTGAG